MSLSPQDTQIFAMKASLAAAHFLAGRFDDALTWAEAAVRAQPKFTIAICIAAASAALSNRPAKAERSIAQLNEVSPDLRISNLERLLPIQRPVDLARMVEGLRKAGLAE
jgi:tetratricopeptide (TPR) repeat protein